jgi:hypothetical protein
MMLPILPHPRSCLKQEANENHFRRAHNSKSQNMKLSSIAIVCSLTIGGKTLGFAKAAGFLAEVSMMFLTLDNITLISISQLLFPFAFRTDLIFRYGWARTRVPRLQNLTSKVVRTRVTRFQNLNRKHSIVLQFKRFGRPILMSLSGEITTEEEVAAEVDEVLSPNLSIDEQISSIANDICDSLSSGKTDVDTSAVETACSAEPRDDEAVVDAASILQAENTPKDEEWEAELEETCISIRENRDKIEAALLVLTARSSERRLQDGTDPDSQTPVTSFDAATDMFSMYDCLCDQSNSDNLGCTKKALKFTDAVSQSLQEQAATDFDPERILNDVEETIKKHTHLLRHSGHDASNDATLSLARALSKVDKSLDVSSSVGVCDPPGMSTTPQNNGYKLCL